MEIGGKIIYKKKNNFFVLCILDFAYWRLLFVVKRDSVKKLNLRCWLFLQRCVLYFRIIK